MTDNLPAKSDEQFVKQMVEQGASTERLVQLSNYFLENGLGPKEMLEAVRDMLNAEVPRYDYENKRGYMAPDHKTREKGMQWLYKIHMEFITDKEREQIPAQFVQVFNDFRQTVQQQSPAELDRKYGIEVE